MENHGVMRGVGLVGLMVLVVGGISLYAQQRVSVQKTPATAVRKQEAQFPAGERGQSDGEVRVHHSRQAVHHKGKTEQSGAAHRRLVTGSTSGKAKASVRGAPRSATPDQRRVVPADAYRRMRPAEP